MATHATRMLTATTRETTWADGKQKVLGKALTARAFSLACPHRAFLLAELTLLIASCAQALWTGHGVGSLILTVCCVLFFHLNVVDRSILTFRYPMFLLNVLVSLAFGSWIAALIFRIFPATGVPAVSALLWLAIIGML